jgi:hypothetical protein
LNEDDDTSFSTKANKNKDETVFFDRKTSRGENVNSSYGKSRDKITESERGNKNKKDDKGDLEWELKCSEYKAIQRVTASKFDLLFTNNRQCYLSNTLVVHTVQFINYTLTYKQR